MSNLYFNQLTFIEAVDVSMKILKDASDEWSKGNPEEPTTEQVLGEIINVFQKAKLMPAIQGAIDTKRPKWRQLLDAGKI